MNVKRLVDIYIGALAGGSVATLIYIGVKIIDQKLNHPNVGEYSLIDRDELIKAIEVGVGIGALVSFLTDRRLPDIVVPF
jgi:hypothetical protein